VTPGAARIEAPDFAEPFEAWRVWRVVDGPDGFQLGSVIKPTLWPAGLPLVAECLRGPELFARLRRKRRTCGVPPGEECDCGIYAAWLPQIGQYLNDVATTAARAVARVLGQVSLWGTVVECERGFRASRAYPRRIYVPMDAVLRGGPHWDELVAGLQAYEVPVEPLSARCCDAIDALEQKQLAGLRAANG